MSERHPVPRDRREDSPASAEVSPLDEQEGGEIKTSIYWSSGPLPDPVQLRQYEEVLPSAAERIMSTFETQVGHRMELERKQSQRADWGLAVGGILAGAIVIGGLVVMIVGDPWAGASIIGTSVAAIAGVFVYGTKIRRGERDREDERI